MPISPQDHPASKVQLLDSKAAKQGGQESSGEWTLRHKNGEHMEADLGTKALTSARFEMLKKELGMASNFCAEADKIEGGQPALDVRASTAGGEQGACPHQTLERQPLEESGGQCPHQLAPSPKIEAETAVLKWCCF